jgi:hypothetical protein
MDCFNNDAWRLARFLILICFRNEMSHAVDFFEGTFSGAAEARYFKHTLA